MSLGSERIIIPDVNTKRELFDILSDANVPQIISSVLQEWQRRALESLRLLDPSEAVVELENILELVLESRV